MGIWAASWLIGMMGACANQQPKEPLWHGRGRYDMECVSASVGPSHSVIAYML